MTPPRTTQDAAGRPPFRRGGARRRRQCYCKESTVDYKDVSSIRRFITDRGRIEAGKKSGNCAKCQRNLTTAIKRARHLALLPYAPDHLRVTGTVSAGGKISDEEETTEEETSTEADEATVVAEAVEESTEETASRETEAVAEEVSTEVAEESSEETDEVTEDVPSEEASETVDDSSDEEEK
ncbi:MAG: 30S ribosomal protein S18 [Chloroflexi bacterium]|nr:30S ribosomal protein S18 [Chloroflexota bacterium]MBT3864334.1 30S ribosomal protein S18 [Chloroflexota bacterium]MBT4142574.1 30S ribosomal protein S18 [Chloroflexota bacterium]MBT4942701.1 30S ribosomal protein S18 [Chloroflexota bacterium]MBT6706832.1 30S ribosomal protein S18 [Chloroflexota bacterium]